MDVSGINLVAVLVAALAAFVVGFLWHGPLFGTKWASLMGISKAQMDAEKAKGMGPMLPTLGISYVQQVVVALVLAHLGAALRVDDPMKALVFAVLVWFGFYATTLLNAVLWEKRKLELYVLNVGYHLAALVVMSLVLVWMH